MKNSFVEKLRAETELPEPEGKYFGYEPQTSSRALMFEVRTRDGRRSALPYSYLTRADYTPEDGIHVFVSNVVILVKGRGLDEVFAYLLQNRLTWLREDFSGTDTAQERIFVESIEIKERGEFIT